jgi:hypothetical protein
VGNNRVIGGVLTGTAVLCALVPVLASSVVLHGTAFVGVAVVGVLAWFVAYAVTRDGGRAVAWAWAWQIAGALVGLIMLLTGVVVLAGPGPATVVGCLIVGGGAAMWLTRLVRGQGMRWGRARTPAIEVPWAATKPLLARLEWDTPVSILSTSVLGREWLRTTAALSDGLDAVTRHEVVRRRQTVLDEMECRDPVGFARWMAAGAADHDPTVFLRADRSTDTDAA